MLENVKYFFKNLETLKNSSVSRLALAEKLKIKDTFSEVCPAYIKDVRKKASKSTKENRVEVFNKIGNPALNFRGRFLNTYNTIFQNEEFAVFFGEDESSYYNLKKYLIDDYFEGDFVKNYTEKILQYLVDEPNGVFFVLPEEPNGTETQKINPKVYFEPAENVLFYSSRMALIKSSEKIKLVGDPEGQTNGSIYYYFDNFSWTKITQKNNGSGSDLASFKILGSNIVEQDGKLLSIDFFKHYCQTMPVYLIGIGVEGLDNFSKQYYRRSVIYNAIPSIRTAQNCFLDFHTHLAQNSSGFMWAYGNGKCKTCKGEGILRNGKEHETCKTCNGSDTSAMDIHSGDIGDVAMFKLASEGLLQGQEGKSLPTPSQMFGRFDGNTEGAEHFWKMYLENEKKAYLACNMESIGDRQEQGSGIKKALEQEEKVNFLKSLSKIVCELLQNLLRDIFYQKFFVALVSEGKFEEIKNYVPFVRTPENFDLITKIELFDLVKSLNLGGYSNSILIKQMLKLAEKEFGKESMEFKKELFKSKIDPMAGVATFDKEKVLPTLTWEQSVLSFQLHNIISICELEMENEVVCELKQAENKLKLDCKPIVNAFWKLSFMDQKAKVEAKAKLIADQTKGNQQEIFNTGYNRNYRGRTNSDKLLVN